MAETRTLQFLVSDTPWLSLGCMLTPKELKRTARSLPLAMNAVSPRAELHAFPTATALLVFQLMSCAAPSRAVTTTPRDIRAATKTDLRIIVPLPRAAHLRVRLAPEEGSRPLPRRAKLAGSPHPGAPDRA